jgi:hypothetical protein
VVARNIAIFQKRMIALKFAKALPTLSPTDMTWPTASNSLMHRIGEIARPLYYDYRCNLYRLTYDKASQLIMREKLLASQVSD